MTTETTKYNSKKKKVLIIDDEPDVNTVLKMVLHQNGFNTDSYDDPILAVGNFKTGTYDLLPLDINKHTSVRYKSFFLYLNITNRKNLSV